LWHAQRVATTWAERKAALEEAIGQAALTCRFPDGSSVTYRSVEELQAALAVVEGEIADAAGAPRGVRRLILCSTDGRE
jgi:hypothetical protein